MSNPRELEPLTKEVEDGVDQLVRRRLLEENPHLDGESLNATMALLWGIAKQTAVTTDPPPDDQ